METPESIAQLLHLGPQKPLQPPRFAKVAAVAGDTVTVALGQGTAEAVRCCPCSVGDVALLETLPNGTLAAVATRGAAGGGSVPQNLSFFGRCTTAAGTAEKAVTCQEDFTLAIGARITVQFTQPNTATANVALNVNGTGAVYVATTGRRGNISGWGTTYQCVTFVYDYANPVSPNPANMRWHVVGAAGMLIAGGDTVTDLNAYEMAFGGMTHYLSGSTSTGAPTWPSHIVHMGPLNTHEEAQIAIPLLGNGDAANVSNKTPEWRVHTHTSNMGADYWSPWYKIYSEAHPPTTDEISGTYTDGIWTVRKWADGTAECWATYTWTITSWSTWGNVYYSNSTGAITYPSGLFVSAPVENATGSTSSNDAWLYARGSTPTATGTKDYAMMRPVSGTTSITGYLNVYAVGRWK